MITDYGLIHFLTEEHVFLQDCFDLGDLKKMYGRVIAQSNALYEDLVSLVYHLKSSYFD